MKDGLPEEPVPAERRVARAHHRREVPAVEDEAARACDDRLVHHEAFFVERWEARDVVGVRLVLDHAAPGDLKSHPDGLAAGGGDHLPRHVADDADVLVREIRVHAWWIGDRVDVGTGDVECGPIWRETRGRSERRLRDDDGMIRIERLQLLIRAHESGGGNGAWLIRIRRLVDSLIDAERSVALQAVRDPREQLLVYGTARRRQVRDRTQLQPTVKPFRRSRVEDGLLLRDLCVDLLQIPLHEACANEVDARARDLGPAVGATRRLAAERGRIGKRDRENLRPVDRQAARGLVDADGHVNLAYGATRPSLASRGLSRLCRAKHHGGAVAPYASAVTICTSCGRENRDEARFCDSCGAPLARPEARELRKVVTILFCDVTGSTALGERLDSESLRRVMERYFAVAREALERHGGTVEKFIGDAVMAVFGIPVVHEDDALRAARAAQELREELATLNAELDREFGTDLQVRIGVNTGEVVTNDTGTLATGDAVNVAARLEQAAKPDEILIGEATRQLAESALELEPVDPIDARG